MDAKHSNQSLPSPSAEPPPAWAGGLFNLLAIAAVLSTGLVTSYGLVAKPQPVSAAPPPEETPADLCHSADDGYLTGTLYGSIKQAIDWRGPALECDGMPRPGGNGIRLVFAGAGAAPNTRLVMVLGIEGQMNELMSAERMANITIIDESAGRIFSTGGANRCWTTVESVISLTEQNDNAFQVGGEVYCSGSLPSLSDAGSVMLRNFRYSGRLILDAS